MEEVRDDVRIKCGESPEQEGGCSGSKKKDTKNVHFAPLMDICDLKKCGVTNAISEVQRQSCASRRHCERRLWSPRSFC